MMATAFNNWNKIALAVPQASGQAVRKVAFDGQANIQNQIRANDQVDTGFMVNGIYVVTSQESTYQGGEDALPEVPKPPDDQTAYVASAAKYSAPQNYGTRYIAGRNFFETGIERTKAEFDAAMATIKDEMEQAAR
jgi:hypothetical protein